GQHGVTQPPAGCEDRIVPGWGGAVTEHVQTVPDAPHDVLVPGAGQVRTGGAVHIVDVVQQVVEHRDWYQQFDGTGREQVGGHGRVASEIGQHDAQPAAAILDDHADLPRARVDLCRAG